MAKNYIFVGHSKGSFEGTVFDNIVLSDRLRAFKCRNKTGQESFPALSEGVPVEVQFEISGGFKDSARVDVVSLKPLK